MWKLDHKEGWVLKNWCFWIVILEKNLRIPWTAKRSNQLILMKINLEYSLKGLMLKLQLWYFGHLMQRNDSLEQTMMLAKFEGGRRRGQLRMRWLDGISDLTDMGLSKLWELVMDREACHAAFHRVTNSHDSVTELHWMMKKYVPIKSKLLYILKRTWITFYSWNILTFMILFW